MIMQLLLTPPPTPAGPPTKTLDHMSSIVFVFF